MLSDNVVEVNAEVIPCQWREKSDEDWKKERKSRGRRNSGIYVAPERCLKHRRSLYTRSGKNEYVGVYQRGTKTYAPLIVVFVMIKVRQ